LPLYIQDMGYTDVGSIATWAGFAFGITELVLAVTIPLWGIVADRYGRKPMLIRASLGMAVVLALTRMVTSVG